MDEQLIDRAVDAAAKADYEALRRGHWDEQPDDFRDAFRSDVRPLVTAALAEVESSITAECDDLAARAEALDGRCLADITHRDDESRWTTCVLQKGHATAHDDALGCTWTDAGHWQPSERDHLAARIARVEALHQPIERVYYHATVTECSLCLGSIYPCPTIKSLRGGPE